MKSSSVLFFDLRNNKINQAYVIGISKIYDYLQFWMLGCFHLSKNIVEIGFDQLSL